MFIILIVLMTSLAQKSVKVYQILHFKNIHDWRKKDKSEMIITMVTTQVLENIHH